MVSPDKQIWKCFGCLKGGDIFTFIMEMEGLNFREALELLAQRAGVELKRTKPREEYQKEKDIKTRLYQINDLSSRLFHKILLEHRFGQKARDYLKKRGVNQATIKDFKLGYAPLKPVLHDFLFQKGFSEEEIKQAGSPDKFRNRLCFPILDIMGNIIGFSARALAENQEPKYLNTPETPIFHKGRILYGLDKAKTEIKKEKKSLLVEGQMDVVLSHQAGVKSAVASSGTALTQDHLETLCRYTPDIIFAFDQDKAGTEAAKKSIDLAIINEMNVKMVLLPPEFKDAGEAIAKDPKIWQSAVKKAIPAVDWYFQSAFGGPRINTDEDTDKHGLTVDEKKAIARELLPVIKKIPDRIEQRHYIQLLAKKLAVPERTIDDALGRVRSTKDLRVKTKEQKSPGLPSSVLGPEEILAALLAKFPEHLNRVINELDYQDFRKNSAAQKIYKFLQSCYTKSSCQSIEKACDFKKEFQLCLKKELDLDLQKELEILILTIEEQYKTASAEEIREEIINCSRRIKEKQREKIKEEFARRIKEAEESNDREKVKKLVEEFQRVISK